QSSQVSNITSIIADLHVLHTRKCTRDPVRLQHFQAELNVRKHDVGGTARNDVDGLAVLFLVLDPAGGELAAEAVCFDDEAAAVLLGKRCKADLLRASLPDEYPLAIVRIRCPGTGKVDRLRALEREQPVKSGHGDHDPEHCAHAASPSMAFGR